MLTKYIYNKYFALLLCLIILGYILSNTIKLIESKKSFNYSSDANNNNIISLKQNVSTENNGMSNMKAEIVHLILNVTQYPGEQCNRICIENDNRICYYHFVLEHYEAMGVACGKCGEGIEDDCNNVQCIVGDGTERGVMSINRQIPGPWIQVCHGDYIIVDVTNKASGTAGTLHWHGLNMKQTPYMDGVPYLTQCPIPFSNTFRYEYNANLPGTYYYHSHSGFHKGNGQYGALIVRQPLTADPMSSLYDYDLPEHVLLVSNWMKNYEESYFTRRVSSKNFVINGRGQNNNWSKSQPVPPTIFYVKPHKRYRFRFINSISHAYSFKMQIENHTFSVIAADSHNVRPQTYTTLISNSGERYDFVLYTNHTSGDFWIRVQNVIYPEANVTEAFALLRYVNNGQKSYTSRPPYPTFQAKWPEYQILNHPESICQKSDQRHCITQLRPIDENNADLRSSTPDYKFFLGFANYIMPSEKLLRPNNFRNFMSNNIKQTFIGLINNISFTYPAAPPLTQSEDIDESQYCNEEHLPEKCQRDYNDHKCFCTHRLQVKLNSIVEMILVDETAGVESVSHPFHLHGHSFMVLGLGQYSGTPMNVSLAKRLESKQLLFRLPNNIPAPYKDTISIPPRGYVIIRFKADNPGIWLFHCHYELHFHVGMGLMLQVGTSSEIKKAPHDFPRCGNYVPPVKKPIFSKD